MKEDIDRYVEYIKTTYRRNIPITEADLIRNTLLHIIASNFKDVATASFTTANYSSAIAINNTPQDLATANKNRTSLTIQNLDNTDVLLVGIGEDAYSGRSYEIEPRGVGVVEEGEADKRISVLSSKTGLKFVAIARLKR